MAYIMHRRKDRYKSNLFSRIFNLTDDESQDTTTEENPAKNETPYLKESLSLQTQNSSRLDSFSEEKSFISQSSSSNSSSDIEIPLRRQSRLYTPYHDDTPLSSPTIPYGVNTNNRLSNQQLHVDYNSSQLTRSVSWNPQKQQQQDQPQRSNRPVTMIATQDNDESIHKRIPDRRTSRNYANDPEAQARLNQLLSNERKFFVRRTSMIDRKPPPL